MHTVVHEFKQNGETKMLSLKNNGQVTAPTYATQRNTRFIDDSSKILEVQDRWMTTYNSLPNSNHRDAVDNTLNQAISEFRLNNPNLKSWADVKALLPDSKDAPMVYIKIDATMQRLLKMYWSMEIVNGFKPTKVVPIQVYKPDNNTDVYIAWDGQHTLVALWLIATQVFGEDPKTVMIPVNVYKTNLKSEMRDSFVGHNGGDYKEGLDQYDKIEQMIYGVRIDRSKNPEWQLIEQKQQIVEHFDLFLTKKDNGDADQPGAISRMQEFQKLTPDALGWLCEYLVAVGCHNRSAEEKELVMMAYFFERCRAAKVPVTKKFIQDIASVAKRHWRADFSPMSVFWQRAGIAYNVWHTQHVSGVTARFNKEPMHGYPFLIEQLKKDLPQYKFPEPRSSSEFVPAKEDLFI